MSNFIYYEKLQDYEEQVRKAKEYDKLQQELQRKDNIINELKEYIEEVGDKRNELYERIEKAVEYIQNHQLVFELSSKKVISQWFDMFYKDIIDILNGKE